MDCARLRAEPLCASAITIASLSDSNNRRGDVCGGAVATTVAAEPAVSVPATSLVSTRYTGYTLVFPLYL